MSDTCSVCGRHYLTYSEGHTPNSSTCLEIQLYDIKDRLFRAEGVLERLGYRHCDIAACNCNSYHRWKDVPASGTAIPDKTAELQRELADCNRMLDETRAKLPTMAQVMVYGSLLRKFKKSQADLAEATAALRQCDQLFNYLNNKGGLGLDVHDMIRKVQDEIKSCIGGAE